MIKEYGNFIGKLEDLEEEKSRITQQMNKIIISTIPSQKI